MDQFPPEEQQWKKTLGDIMNDNISPELNQKMDASFDNFHHGLKHHPSLQPSDASATSSFFTFLHFATKYAWQLTVLLALIVLPTFLLLGESAPTWADVTSHFKTIPFCHAVVNAKQSHSPHAVQFDIWMGYDECIRMRYGSQIVFANTKGMIKAYDTQTQSETEPDEMLVDVVEKLHIEGGLSLETVIKSLTGSMSDLITVSSRIEEAAEDLSIFDLAQNNHEKSIRIWTLRESLLPIYLQQKDIRNDEELSIFFSYIEPKPPSFFEWEEFIQNRT